MNNSKGLYGFFSIGPLALGILGFVPIIISIIKDYESRDPPVLAILGFAIWGLAAILGLIGFILFLVHMGRNMMLSDGARIGWIVGMCFAFFMAMGVGATVVSLIYFFIEIRNPRPLQPPRQPMVPNPWDSKLNS